jgi:hypothetical protein
MNRRLYAAASRLSDAECKRDRDAFWGSLPHAKVNHRSKDGQIANLRRPGMFLRSSNIAPISPVRG